MSLAKALVDAGAKLVEDKGADWIGKALGSSDDLIATLPKEQKAGALQARDYLAQNKEPFARLGNLGFAKLASYVLEDDDEAAARAHYLEFEATFDERIASQEQGSDRLINSQDADNAASDAAIAVLKQVGSLALPFILKFAAAAVGIPL